MLNSLKQLGSSEKRTFKFHLGYTFIDGLLLGALALNEFVFLKSLKGSDYQMGYLFLFSMAVMVFSVVFNEVLRRSQSKKGLLRWITLVSRLPLLLLYFFPTDPGAYDQNSIYHILYLGIFLSYFLSTPIVFPAINLFLRQKYKNSHFGTLYSYATVITRITTLVSTFCIGMMLEADFYAFRYIFPVLGILSIFSVYLFTMIDYEEKQVVFKKGFFNAVGSSVISMIEVLKKNRAYLDFEIGFMLYGFAFMITVSVIKIFFEEVLHLNYASISFYLNLQVLLSVVLLPFFGKLLGKIDPRIFAIITFSALFLYILFLEMSQFFPAGCSLWEYKIYIMLVLSFISYAFFSATNGLLWWIGSAYFCTNEDAGLYQSIHLTLTGFRALIAPIFGIWFYNQFGFTFTFNLALVGLVVAIIYLFLSYRKFANHNSENSY